MPLPFLPFVSFLWDSPPTTHQPFLTANFGRYEKKRRLLAVGGEVDVVGEKKPKGKEERMTAKETKMKTVNTRPLR